jgi:hypothetical protein
MSHVSSFFRLSLETESINVVLIHYKEHGKQLFDEQRVILESCLMLNQLIRVNRKYPLNKTPEGVKQIQRCHELGNASYRASHQLFNDIVNAMTFGKFKEYKNSCVQAGKLLPLPLDLLPIADCIPKGKYLPIDTPHGIAKNGRMLVDEWKAFRPFMGVWSPTDDNGTLISLFMKKRISADLDIKYDLSYLTKEPMSMTAQSDREKAEAAKVLWICGLSVEDARKAAGFDGGLPPPDGPVYEYPPLPARVVESQRALMFKMFRSFDLVRSKKNHLKKTRVKMKTRWSFLEQLLRIPHS